MDSVKTARDVSNMHELTVSTRDLATSFVGDPIQGEAIVQRALRWLRREHRAHELDMARTRDFLEDRVAYECLKRSGCAGCVDEYETWDATSPTEDDPHEDESEDDSDLDDEMSLGWEAA
jgi:hypothetical protein